MKTTINIDDKLLEQAQNLTSISEKTALIRTALETLIEKASRERLRKLAGTEKQLKNIPRR
jgi:Arc/MetJ family transcription regulator